MSFKQLYPFQPNFFHTAHGPKMHYVTQGQRGEESILMVHGNPTWSLYYRDLIKHFSQSYHVVVPDHIGCGFSEKPNKEDYSYQLSQRIDDLEQLVDHLDLKNITLIAHDWGGMISMGLATKKPHLFKRIILLNTAAFPKPKTKLLPKSIGICRNRLVGPILVQGLNAFCKGALYRCAVKPLTKEVQKAYLLPYSDWRSRQAIFQFVRDIPMNPQHPSYPVLSSVSKQLDSLRTIPRLILWGDQDFVFDHHFLNEWKKIWPDAQFTQFAKAGHYLLEDEPVGVIQRIEEFFSHAC